MPVEQATHNRHSGEGRNPVEPLSWIPDGACPREGGGRNDGCGLVNSLTLQRLQLIRMGFPVLAIKRVDLDIREA